MICNYQLETLFKFFKFKWRFLFKYNDYLMEAWKWKFNFA